MTAAVDDRRAAWVAALLLALLAALILQPRPVAEPLKVTVRSQSGEVEFEPPVTDGRLAPNTRPVIRTGADGLVRIELDDAGTVDIAPGSVVRLLELRRLGGRQALRSVVELDRGEIERRVPPDGLVQDARVLSRGTQIGVRGTALNLTRAGEQLGLSVSSGRVAIADADGRSAEIGAGFGVRVTAGGLQAPEALPPPPEMRVPSRGDTVLKAPIAVSWSARDVEGTRYLVELRTLAGGALVQRLTVNGKALALEEPPRDGRYALVVRAISAGGLRGMPSAALEFVYEGWRERLRSYLRGGGSLPEAAVGPALGGHDPAGAGIDVARALRRAGRFGAALEQVRDVLRHAPGDPAGRRLEAHLLIDTGALDEARARFQGLPASESVEADLGLGLVALLQGNPLDGHRRLCAAVAAAPDRVDIALAAARAAAAVGDRRTALRHLDRLLERDADAEPLRRMRDEIERLLPD